MEMLHPAMTAQLQDALHVSLAVLILTLLQWPVFQSVLAYVQLTPMLPLEPLIILEDALHALINVSLMLLAKLLLLLASALSAHGPHLEAMTILHALLVLLVLLPVEMERLLSLLACASRTGMEMLHKLLLFLLVELILCALNVTSVAPTAVVKPPQAPIFCLLVACALPTLGLPMVPRAHSALLILPPVAVILLPRLLAIASPTFTEMPEPTHVRLAPMAVYLLLSRQELPPRLRIVNAQPTTTQPMESVPLVDAPLVLPHLNPISFTLLRDPDPSLTVPVL